MEKYFHSFTVWCFVCAGKTFTFLLGAAYLQGSADFMQKNGVHACLSRAFNGLPLHVGTLRPACPTKKNQTLSNPAGCRCPMKGKRLLHKPQPLRLNNTLRVARVSFTLTCGAEGSTFVPCTKTSQSQKLKKLYFRTKIFNIFPISNAYFYNTKTE